MYGWQGLPSVTVPASCGRDGSAGVRLDVLQVLLMYKWCDGWCCCLASRCTAGTADGSTDAAVLL
jgi:hypothetical protein